MSVTAPLASVDSPASARPADRTAQFRKVLLALAAVSVVGTALELASLRHWDGTDQLIPWVVLVVLGVAVAAQWFRPSPSITKAARIVGVVSAASALLGFWEHVHSNYEVAPLDFRYATTWAGMSSIEHWWAAASGGVGASPALAPISLAMAGACLALATLGLPTRPTADEPTVSTESDAADEASA